MARYTLSLHLAQQPQLAQQQAEHTTPCDQLRCAH